MDEDHTFRPAAAHDLRRSIPAPPLVALVLLLGVAVIHGWLAYGCYLINEHRRLVWYEMLVLWLGDAIALFWFTRYVYRWWHEPWQPIPDRLSSRRVPRSFWLMMSSLAFGFVAELGMTLVLRHDEMVAFNTAVPADYTVTAITEQQVGGATTYWKLDGTYQDAAAQVHPVTFYLRHRDELIRLPPAAQNAIRLHQVGTRLQVVYDPQRPSRSWIPQMGWDDGNRLHYLSFVILLFQFLFAWLFFAVLWETMRKRRNVPWWAELHSVLPLSCEAFVFALFGALELYVVRRFCP